ncbi:MAG: hypothetical protein CL489_11050 [Acidobacteria bacterium]|nr:hypothetical protein [Acidobacteriota bacterium]
MTDKEWFARKKAVFGDTLIQKTNADGMDEFIGHLREVEDGKDPHAGDRRTHGEEVGLAFSMRPPPGTEFRDRRDRELWTNRHFLWAPPSLRGGIA